MTTTMAARIAALRDMTVADLREKYHEVFGEETRTHGFPRAHDPRFPMAGTALTREFKGRLLRVTVLDEGFEFGGQVHRSLPAILELVTGTRWNGFLFFRLTAPRAAGGGLTPRTTPAAARSGG